MSKHRVHAAVVSLLLASACGGGGDGDSSGDTSGVPRSTLLVDVSDSQAMDICAWVAQVQGGESLEVTCPDDLTITTDSVDECVEGLLGFDECEAVVADAESCALAFVDDPCTIIADPGCQALLDCSF